MIGTTSRRSQRRRHDGPHHRRILVRGLLTTSFLAALGYVAITSYSGVPGRTYDHVAVELPRVGSLIPHDAVRIHGERVGQVAGITSTDNGRARLDLQLDHGTAVPRDTRVRVRANGLLGARYVELIPGRAADPLPEDAVLRGTRSALTFGVSDVLDTFDSRTRGGLSSMLGGLGQGVLSRGQGLNDAVRHARDAIVPADQLLQELARPATKLGNLIPALDAGVGTLNRNRRPLTRLLEPAASTLSAVAGANAALRASLTIAPETLSAATAGLTRGRDLLVALDALAAAADPALVRAPAALTATTALLRDGRRPLARAEPLIDTARAALPPTLQLTQSLRRVSSRLTNTFGDLRTIADRVAPYGCDITNFASVFRSMTGFGTVGDGPAGPAMHFRLQAAVTPPEEALGTGAISGLVTRIGYPEPCRFLASEYPAPPRPQVSR